MWRLLGAPSRGLARQADQPTSRSADRPVNGLRRRLRRRDGSFFTTLIALISTSLSSCSWRAYDGVAERHSQTWPSPSTRAIAGSLAGEADLAIGARAAVDADRDGAHLHRIGIDLEGHRVGRDLDRSRRRSTSTGTSAESSFQCAVTMVWPEERAATSPLAFDGSDERIARGPGGALGRVDAALAIHHLAVQARGLAAVDEARHPRIDLDVIGLLHAVAGSTDRARGRARARKSARRAR